MPAGSRILSFSSFAPSRLGERSLSSCSFLSANIVHSCMYWSSIPHFSCNPQMIAADDLENGLTRIALRAHEVDERWDLLRRHELEVRAVAFLRRERFRMRVEIVL